MKVYAEILNMPDCKLSGRYVVARRCISNDGTEVELWYYGCYKDSETADRVAIEIGNGIVLEKEVDE